MVSQLRLRYHIRMAMNGFITSDMEQAERHFEKALALHPYDDGISYNLAVVKIGRGDYEAAEGILLDGLARLRDPYQMQRTLADLYYLWGKRDQALEYYTACRKQRRGEGELLRLRAEICRDEQAFSQAVEAASLYQRAVSIMQSDPHQAREMLLQVVRLDPSHYLALNNIGTIHMNVLNDYEGARSYFLQSVALSEQPMVRKNLKLLEKAIHI